MKRKTFVILTIFASVLLAAGLLLSTVQSRDLVTQESFARITKGMSKKEVVELLGPVVKVPDGCCGGYEVSRIVGHPAELASDQWMGDEFCVLIFWDEKRTVVGAVKGVRHRDSWTTKVKRWCGF